MAGTSRFTIVHMEKRHADFDHSNNFFISVSSVLTTFAHPCIYLQTSYEKLRWKYVIFYCLNAKLNVFDFIGNAKQRNSWITRSK